MESVRSGQVVEWWGGGARSIGRVLRVMPPGAGANVRSSLVYVELENGEGRVTVYAYELRLPEELAA